MRKAGQAQERMGGILKVGMQVQKMEDPANFDWTQKSNRGASREYLAITGTDNVTRPMLAESWEASDDLKTWSSSCARGKWHNGEAFEAEHVAFNFTRWLDPELGPRPTAGCHHDTLEVTDKDGKKKVKTMIPGALERVDDHTVRLT